jgi:hypothetical protein
MEYKSENKVCQNCKQNFVIEPEDFSFYEKIKVPPPTFCFRCRLQRRLSFFNLRSLYKRKCNSCQKDIISMYRPESDFNVICISCYRNREDGLKYGKEYDFSKTFFEQFFDLYRRVPVAALKQNSTSINCDYANHTYHAKNVYLSYMVSRSEDVMYSQDILMGNKICIDSFNMKDSERSYENFFGSRDYNTRFLVRASRCIDSSFLFDCMECNNCFMSTNLRNKSYVFRNQQLSRAEYLKKIKEIDLGSFKVQEELKKEFEKLTQNVFCQHALMRATENCTGDFIGHSKNVHYSFSCIDAEDCKFIIFGANTVRDSYDLSYNGILESCYEVLDCGGNTNKALFTFGQSAGNEIFYTVGGKNNQDLFGCAGLENKSYCILNKQYTKEEYREMVEKIKKHMDEMPYVDKGGRVYKYGEFFPIEFSPFAYNETLAYEEFPMSKDEVSQNGYIWRDAEEKHYSTTIQTDQLPDHIKDVSDKILNEIIGCPNRGQIETKCTFGFKIMQDELRFYRLMNIPLPRYCPNCRYYARRKWKNPWKLWHRQCMCQSEGHNHDKKCPNEFETAYAPTRPERVYCKECYQKEVY